MPTGINKVTDINRILWGTYLLLLYQVLSQPMKVVPTIQNVVNLLNLIFAIFPLK